MPYYRWTGIDLNGCTQHGNECAQSLADLQAVLLQREIGLVRARAGLSRFVSKKIDAARIVEFFNQLAVMISAGVHLSHALKVLAQQTRIMRLKEIIYDLFFDVERGASLSESMSRFAQIFSQPMVRMVQAGQEAGKLDYTLTQLSHYLDMKEQMRKKLRAASIVPIITLTLFVIIALAIFIFIVPSFERIFSMTGRSIPAVTQTLFAISAALRSSQVIVIAVGIFVVGLFLRLLFKTKRAKRMADHVLLYIPFMSRLIKYSELVYFLQTLAVLINGGVHMITALSIARQTVSNTVLRSHLEQLEGDVSKGASLAVAMADNPSRLFSEDIIAMVIVGQESSQLGFMLSKATELYYQHLNRLINRFTKVFQPLLMAVLGILVAALIFMVYVPVFNLADVVTF